MSTIYPKKYAHGFVVLCFVVVTQSFIMNSHEVFIHIHQGCFARTGAIARLPQCQWSKPDGYGKISQCITTTKHSKAKTVCIFLGIYCSDTSHSAPTELFTHYLTGTGLPVAPLKPILEILSDPQGIFKISKSVFPHRMFVPWIKHDYSYKLYQHINPHSCKNSICKFLFSLWSLANLLSYMIGNCI